jgi:Periplasmic protein involved in polysaccharide export
MFKLLIAMMSCILVMSHAQSAEIIIRSGDVLQIEIPGEIDFEKTFQVKRDGTLNLPEVGKVSIAGKTLVQVNEDLAQRLGEEYRAINNFKVYLVERRVPVQVLGFVKIPGIIDLPQDGNIQMALQKAGGASSRCSTR